MNIRKLILIIMITLGACAILSVPASAYTIDGSLADWGVTPGAYCSGSSDWIPDTGIWYAVDDNNPAINYVGPGYGGQEYDAEAIYIDFDSSNLYFSVVTGFPGSGTDEYKPGDIALDFDMDGFYEYGIDTTGNGAFTKGSLYSVSEWGTGSWEGVGAPTEILSGTEILNPVTSNLVYNKTYYGSDDHYVIEGYMPISAFGSDWNPSNFKAHWTMTCANDYIEVTVTPEPTTLMLFGVGLLGLGRLRKRKIRTRS